MADLFTHCENLTLWGISQPFNILSSTGFWFIAWWLYYQHRPKLWSYPFWLVAGIECIGWASIFWHFTHSALGVSLDIASVVVWLAAYGAYVLHKYCRWSYFKGMILAFIFLILAWVLGRIMNPWLPQTSGAFLPIVALLLWAGRQQQNIWWIYSGTSLALATMMRILDMPLCSIFPIGTHALWHIGCAFSLYFAVKAMHLKPKTSREALLR